MHKYIKANIIDLTKTHTKFNFLKIYRQTTQICDHTTPLAEEDNLNKGLISLITIIHLLDCLREK